MKFTKGLVAAVIASALLFGIGLFTGISMLSNRTYEGTETMPKSSAQELALHHGDGDFTMLPLNTEGDVEITYHFKASGDIKGKYGLAPLPLTTGNYFEAGVPIIAFSFLGLIAFHLIREMERLGKGW